jgi:hypothetical protein
MAWWNNPFGFKIRKDQEESVSFVTPKNDDGAIERISSGAGFYGYNFGFEFVPKNEVELINKYRALQMLPEIDSAIEEIVSEAIVAEGLDEDIIKLNLNVDDDEIPENVREIICNEFENIISIMQFTSKGHDIFRQWYVDGRLYYHIVVDEENLQAGIQEVRSVDPRKMKKVREIQKHKTGQGLDVITDIEFWYYRKQWS